MLGYLNYLCRQRERRAAADSRAASVCAGLFRGGMGSNQAHEHFFYTLLWKPLDLSISQLESVISNTQKQIGVLQATENNANTVPAQPTITNSIVAPMLDQHAIQSIATQLAGLEVFSATAKADLVLHVC